MENASKPTKLSHDAYGHPSGDMPVHKPYRYYGGKLDMKLGGCGQYGATTLDRMSVTCLRCLGWMRDE